MHFATYPFNYFYFIKTKYIFQGDFDYFNQTFAELHYCCLCSLLQNSPIFDLRGQTCTETDLIYRRGGNLTFVSHIRGII
ncbi:MAG TPA: hypothetical protein DCQ76_06485 [Ruminococcaceae bacterium]|nr:hypothetical protein [Oscillospiraceae bacterium]